jgi:hypothetical protein
MGPLPAPYRAAARISCNSAGHRPSFARLGMGYFMPARRALTAWIATSGLEQTGSLIRLSSHSWSCAKNKE